MSSDKANDDVISRVRKALDFIRRGKMIIVTDHVERENEGDLVMAAEFVQACDINFMCTEARGLICLSMDALVVDSLHLAPMCSAPNKSKQHTNFTSSIE